MDIDRFGWVKDGMVPFVEFDGKVFYGLPGYKYPTVFNAIVADIDCRFLGNRPYYQHKHYEYKSDDIVVEVGAYLGYYTMSVAPTVKQVVAIEMIPDLYKIMKMNLEPYPNVMTVMKGITNTQGAGTACKGSEQRSSLNADVAHQFSPGCEDIEVDLDTLDNILDENDIDIVDMMIIQVNGSEREVLEGLTLSRVKNFAIAIPYSEGMIDLLNDFETVIDNNIMIYGRACDLSA